MHNAFRLAVLLHLLVFSFGLKLKLLQLLGSDTGLQIGSKPVKTPATGYKPDLCSVCSCTVTISLSVIFTLDQRLFVKCCIFQSGRQVLRVNATSVAAVYSYVIACKYVTVCNFIFIAVLLACKYVLWCFRCNSRRCFVSFYRSELLPFYCVRSTADVSQYESAVVPWHCGRDGVWQYSWCLVTDVKMLVYVVCYVVSGVWSPRFW